jgi:hypothetical protein
LGHAHDFALPLLRFVRAAENILLIDLSEYHASHEAFEYVREENDRNRDRSLYVLYPAYGTYAGGYLFRYGSVIGAVLGHIWGREKPKLNIHENRNA